MATGRTLEKHTRFYVTGEDMSGYSRSVGPLEQTYDEPELTTWTDACKGYLPGLLHANIGTYNAIFHTSLWIKMTAMVGSVVTNYLPNIIIAKGIRAAPAAGDPAFCGYFNMKNFQTVDDGGAVVATMVFDGFTHRTPSSVSGSFPTNYNPWGTILHAEGEETGANTGTGYDNPTGATTNYGGVLFVQLTGSGNNTGTARISVDESDNNVAFGGLSGAAITFDLENETQAAFIALSATAAVKRYLRWQLALASGANGCRFVSAFCRNYHA